MKPIQKKIVTDEAMNPIAVLIDYEDWQRIEKILETYSPSEDDKPDFNQYSGSIKLSQDPIEYQQKIRNEWH